MTDERKCSCGECFLHDEWGYWTHITLSHDGWPSKPAYCPDCGDRLLPDGRTEQVVRGEVVGYGVIYRMPSSSYCGLDWAGGIHGVDPVPYESPKEKPEYGCPWKIALVRLEEPGGDERGEADAVDSD